MLHRTPARSSTTYLQKNVDADVHIYSMNNRNREEGIHHGWMNWTHTNLSPHLGQRLGLFACFIYNEDLPILPSNTVKRDYIAYSSVLISSSHRIANVTINATVAYYAKKVWAKSIARAVCNASILRRLKQMYHVLKVKRVAHFIKL